MTYNDWRDELKSNLLSVSESERKKVLDYYAEAYADRREAGFSEREIIEEFGAPYDAAQRILSETLDDESSVPPSSPRQANAQEPPSSDKQKDNEQEPPSSDKQINNAQEPPSPATGQRKEKGAGYVMLCILFAIMTGVLAAICGALTGVACVVPFAFAGSGLTAAVHSIILMAGGDVSYGFVSLGCGIMLLGVAIALFSVLGTAIYHLWKLYKKIILSTKTALCGKEQTK